MEIPLSPAKSGSGRRIRPDQPPLRPTKQPRVAAEAQGEGSKAAEEAQVPKVAVQAERSKAADEAQGPKVAVQTEGPKAANYFDKTTTKRRRYCLICDQYDHCATDCEWQIFCPLDAKVNPRYAEVICCCCGENPGTAHPGQPVYARRAVLK